MVEGALAVVGFVLGLVVGRWWALAAPIAFGIWVTAVSELEVPGWLIGGIWGPDRLRRVAGGVLLRRYLRRQRGHS